MALSVWVAVRRILGDFTASGRCLLASAACYVGIDWILSGRGRDQFSQVSCTVLFVFGGELEDVVLDFVVAYKGEQRQSGGTALAVNHVYGCCNGAHKCVG